MKKVAERVTDTEVRLTLPHQKSPDGRTFTIEGIVDIIREDDETWMYDIKTHDPEYVEANKEFYEKQLNVYAHIWQGLRGEPLDQTAVISTAFPKSLKKAIQDNDPYRLFNEMEKWNPEIPITYHQDHVDDTIDDFGKTVDCIERKEFSPPPPERLKEKLAGTNSAFGRRICRRCDARFSCSSYRSYILQTGKRIQSDLQQFFADIADDDDQEEWINSNLEDTDFDNIQQL